MKTLRTAVRTGGFSVLLWLPLPHAQGQNADREARFREGREAGILPYVVEERGRSVPRSIPGAQGLFRAGMVLGVGRACPLLP